ncbi:unnamed protein product [Amoebophrya sp. A120]|nr:unnamed protein product [Amoebophrya sp. A120]|eukprot:GSA120T00005384001.1
MQSQPKWKTATYLHQDLLSRIQISFFTPADHFSLAKNFFNLEQPLEKTQTSPFFLSHNFSKMPIGQFDIAEFYTDDELGSFRAKFDEFDKTGSGYIEDVDCPELIATWFPKHLSKTAFKKAFQSVNSERPGMFDFEEFVVIMIKVTNARRRADRIDYADYLESYQLRELNKLYAKYVNEHGSISSSQFRTLFQDLGMKDLDDKSVANMIEEVDKDKSGEIEFDEFANLWCVLTGAIKRINYREFLTNDQIRMYRRTFEVADADGSGFIDMRELMALFKRLGMAHTPEQVQDELRKVDADNSGELSFDEFCVLMVGIGSEKKKKIINRETYTVNQLEDEEFTIMDIRRAGFPLSKLRGRYPVKALMEEGGWTVIEFRLGGFSVREMLNAGCSPAELKCAGFSSAELKAAGVDGKFIEKLHIDLSERLKTEDPEKVLTVSNLTGVENSLLPLHSTPRIQYHTNYRPPMSQDAQQKLAEEIKRTKEIERKEKEVSGRTEQMSEARKALKTGQGVPPPSIANDDPDARPMEGA